MKFTLIEDVVARKVDSAIQSVHPMGNPLLMSSGVPRSEGLHLSQITGAIFYGEKKEDDNAGYERMATGFAWEHMLSWAIGQVFHQADIVDAGILVHPGEVERGGILMSPDAVWVYDNIFEEFKATWMSALKTPEDFRSWLCQIKSYALALGMNTCRLRVWHVNGAYHKGSGRCADGPCVKTWLLEFSDEELAENWHMITQFAEEKGWLPS